MADDLHIDQWSYSGGVPDGVWKDTPTNRVEGEELERRMKRYAEHGREFPYFNGYGLQTKPHRDGECEEHQPKGRVWERFEEVS